MRKFIYLFIFVLFSFSYGEQLDPYGACLTKVNKAFKKEIEKCEKQFYRKMLAYEKEDIFKAESYAKMFQACIQREKALYEIGKTRCEVLYRE